MEDNIDFKSIIKTNGFLLFAIALVMLNNLEHIATEHYFHSHKVFPVLHFSWLPENFDLINKLFSLLTIAAIELSMLYATILGETFFVVILSLLMIVFHISYYDLLEKWEIFSTQDKVVKISFSIFYVASIILYSEVFGGKIRESKAFNGLGLKIITRKKYLEQVTAEVQQEKASLEQIKDETLHYQKITEQEQVKLEQIKLEIEQHEKSLKQVKNYNKQLETKLKSKGAELEKELAEVEHELTCPHCNNIPSSVSKSMAAHKGICKKRNQ